MGNVGFVLVRAGRAVRVGVNAAGTFDDGENMSNNSHERWDNSPSAHWATGELAERYKAEERRRDWEKRIFWGLLIAGVALVIFWAVR